MAVAGDRRRSRTLRIWVRRQPGLETRIFTNSPSFLGTVCHRGFGETTTDICRYRCLIGCPSVAAPQSARAKTGRTSNEPSKEVCGSFSAFPDVGWALCHALPRSDSRLSAIPKAAGTDSYLGAPEHRTEEPDFGLEVSFWVAPRLALYHIWPLAAQSSPHFGGRYFTWI